MSHGLVLDSSALLAVLLGEAKSDDYLSKLITAKSIKMSAFTWLESIIVITAKKGPEGIHLFRELLTELKVKITPFTPGQAEIAFQGWMRFGKGRHPAELNLGDCVSYATAQSESLSLLFKGGDFSQTDVATAH